MLRVNMMCYGDVSPEASRDPGNQTGVCRLQIVAHNLLNEQSVTWGLGL